jgi:hypothetical protein
MIPVRRGPGEAVEIRKRYATLALAILYPHHRIHRREGYRNIGGMSCDARFGPSKDGMAPVCPVHGRATGSRAPLVAGKRVIAVAEIGATGALKDIPADGRHVSKLAGRGE